MDPVLPWESGKPQGYADASAGVHLCMQTPLHRGEDTSTGMLRTWGGASCRTSAGWVSILISLTSRSPRQKVDLERDEERLGTRQEGDCYAAHLWQVVTSFQFCLFLSNALCAGDRKNTLKEVSQSDPISAGEGVVSFRGWGPQGRAAKRAFTEVWEYKMFL